MYAPCLGLPWRPHKMVCGTSTPQVCPPLPLLPPLQLSVGILIYGCIFFLSFLVFLVLQAGDAAHRRMLMTVLCHAVACHAMATEKEKERVGERERKREREGERERERERETR